MREEGRRSRERHIDARRASVREYQRAHAEERKSYKAQWARADRAANPEKWREKSRQQHRQNPAVRFNIDSRRRVAKRRGKALGVTNATLLVKWTYWYGLCWMCGEPAREWDHVKPLSAGGIHCLANLRPACRSCNATKCNRWPWPPEEGLNG